MKYIIKITRKSLVSYVWRLVSCLCLASCVLCLSSFLAPDKFNKKEYLKAANDALKKGSVYSAIDLYQQILQHDSTEASVYYPLAQCYYGAKDYDLAATYYLKASQVDQAKHPDALYYAALNTKMQGKYTEAIDMFRRFSKNYTGDDAVKMKKWARVEIDGCNFALKEGEGDPFIKLIHLGQEVNTNYADMAPTMRDDMLYYSSMHSDTIPYMMSNNVDLTKPVMLSKLYASKKDGSNYEPSTQVTTFDQAGKHIANGDFADDGSKFLYTICETNSLLTPTCDIYMSELNGTEWSEGKRLSDEINLKGSTNTQPWYAKGPNGQDVLFFVSDREGGRGGKDIWYCTVRKGVFSAPRNAGPKINTDRDEETPFYDTKTNTLYFSSNGWISMGGLDIFKSQADGNLHFSGIPENLGAPFNSSCNDWYYRFFKNSDDGYLVSNRPGIFSVHGKTCCDDIFEFKYEKQIYLAVKGRVFDDATHEVIPGATVNLALRSASIENDVVIGTDSTNESSAYFFTTKPDKQYKVTGMSEGYFTSSQTFSTQGITKSDTQVVDIYLKKMEKNKAYRLNNIYYDFDKWDLRPESKATLDTLYNILMENPTIIIELSSHTDSRGSEQYNQVLSQKRAESCVNYLVNDRGIPKERITAVGYGKSKPLEDCSKHPECPQDQSGDCPCHQLNRRTEFKIIGELKGNLIYDNQ